jgi:hypothetical protein
MYDLAGNAGGFNSTYSNDTLLEPTDPLFITLGSAYNMLVLETYGDPAGLEIPFFSADMFNEVQSSTCTEHPILIVALPADATSQQ